MPSKGVLKACTISTIGDLGPNVDARQIHKWVEANGGTFSSSIDDKVTHLICTPEHFRSKRKAITKQTSRFKFLKVVRYDWLEDSLLKKSKKREGPYLLENPVEVKARKREAAKRKLLFSTGGRDREAEVATVKKLEEHCNDLSERNTKDGYHIYRDESGFAYNVMLGRKDKVEKRGSGIRGTLRLYESATEPKTYASYMTSSAAKGNSFTEVVAPRPSSEIVALDLFKKYFRVKTGVEWEERDSDTNKQPSSLGGAPWHYLGLVTSSRARQEGQKISEDSVPDNKQNNSEW